MRNRRLKNSVVLAFLLTLPSCQKDAPPSDPESIFEAVWRDFNVSYPSFPIRKVNWDSIYLVYRPKVTATTSNAELFSIITAMLGTLKDGHVGIVAPFKSFYYNVGQGKPVNFLGANHLPSLSSLLNNGHVIGGILPSNIGYVYIPNWSGSASDFNVIDQIVTTFKSVEGIIIDVRNNGGGNSSNADQVAGRFADSKRIASYVRYKNGSSHDALGNFIEAYIQPVGPAQITNMKIALLTNRRCFSSNEHFITAMSELPYVTTVGDTTGGGSANPISKGLTNGWTYQIGQWVEYRANKETFEAKGIYPDIPVWISKSDSTLGKDTILEMAISIVK